MSEWIVNLLNISITASIIAIIVMLLRLVFKKLAPKRLIVLLWSLVAIKLVCPVSIESNISVIPQKPVQMLQTYNAQHTKTAPIIISPENVYNTSKNEDTTPGQNLAPIPSQIEANGKNVAKTSSLRKLSAWEMAFIVWAAGTTLMLIYMIVSYLLLHRQVRVSLQREKRVYIADGISTSFILGFFNPRIYIPSYLSDDDAKYVLSHEKRHIRHLDHLWKPIGFMLLSVNWFNPIMWAAYLLLCKDIELACDESVISKLDTDGRKEYSSVLLKCSIKRRFITACPIAFGETGIKERVKAMKNYKKPTIIVVLALTLVSALAAPALLTVAKDGTKFKVEANQKLTLNDANISKSDNTNQESTNTTEANNTHDSGVLQIWNDELYNKALPLSNSEKLFQDNSYAKDITDIDNDGTADRVTYATIGEDGENSVIYIEFGDTNKKTVKCKFNDYGLVHPQMVLSKTDENNLIYLHEKSQGSSDEELIYVLFCDTRGNVMLYDGITHIENIYEAMLTFQIEGDIGTVTILNNSDAEVYLRGMYDYTTIIVPASVFKGTDNTITDNTIEYFPKIIADSDTVEIDPTTNTLTLTMYVAISYDPQQSYDNYVDGCWPAISKIELHYENGAFVVQNLEFAPNDEFNPRYYD